MDSKQLKMSFHHAEERVGRSELLIINIHRKQSKNRSLALIFYCSNENVTPVQFSLTTLQNILFSFSDVNWVLFSSNP